MRDVKYICNYCNVFVFDTDEGDKVSGLKPGTTLKDIPESWECPVCSKPKSFLEQVSDDVYKQKKKTYDSFYSGEKTGQPNDLTQYRNNARNMLAGVCAVYKVCDGNPNNLCMGQKYGKAIGFGGAGQGKTFHANFKALEKYALRPKLVKDHHEPEMNTEIFGKKIKMPVLVSSVSGVKISMNDIMSEIEFQRRMLQGAKQYGTIALSGNTVDDPDHPGVDVTKELGGWGIPIFKPQAQDRLLKLFKRAEEAGAVAIGVDLDGCGSTNWALRGKPVYRKGEKDLRELVDVTEKPVIFKGIMTVEDALKVVDSGAKALDVSNHGGRVLDYGQGVAEVLPDIVDECKDKIIIMADGAVRTGFDVLKLLAIGADYALMGRNMARMALSGGADAVKMYLEYVEGDFRRGMLMTGCDSLKEINRNILVGPRQLF